MNPTIWPEIDGSAGAMQGHHLDLLAGTDLREFFRFSQ